MATYPLKQISKSVLNLQQVPLRVSLGLLHTEAETYDKNVIRRKCFEKSLS
jgi:hypothetical protein